MNEKIKSICKYFIVALIALLLGAIGGYRIGRGIRSTEIAKLTEKYNTTTGKRYAALERIAEDNERIRSGIDRAEDRLGFVEDRAAKLKEHNRSAGDRNQQVITDLGGAGQNLEEASRILERYLKE